MTPELQLARAFVATHPARAALTLERMPAPRAAAVLREIPDELAASMLRQMAVTHAVNSLAHLDAEEAAPMLALLTTDDASGLLRPMAPAERERLLGALTPDARDPLVLVLRHPDGTAGALMDPRVFQLPEDILVADARTRLRQAARDLLYYLYIVDRERRIVGVLDIPELMLARPREPVSAAMHRDVDRLSEWTPAAVVREHPGWQLYHAMPVVDERDRLIGAIRYQTLRRIEREAMAGAPDPSLVTARALGELFQLGTTGLVAGLAATGSGGVDAGETRSAAATRAADSDRTATSSAGTEVRDAR